MTSAYGFNDIHLHACIWYVCRLCEIVSNNDVFEHTAGPFRYRRVQLAFSFRDVQACIYCMESTRSCVSSYSGPNISIEINGQLTQIKNHTLISPEIILSLISPCSFQTFKTLCLLTWRNEDMQCYFPPKQNQRHLG